MRTTDADQMMVDAVKKCRMKYAMAYPKEEFNERFGSNDYSSIIKAIVADINKKEVRND